MNLSEKAVSTLIKALEAEITGLEEKLDRERKETFATYLFFCKHHDLIPDFVRHMYSKAPEVAKEAVRAYHDEIMDLSEIEVCAGDFKPW